MSSRSFAAIVGIVFIALGIAGFVPALVHPAAGGALAMDEHGMLLGLFPVNGPHNVVHLLFGIWGLAASRSLGGALTYARAVAIVYAMLTLMGFVPYLGDGFGYLPLYGNDIWLHLGLAAIGAYFGWVHRNPTGRI